MTPPPTPPPGGILPSGHEWDFSRTGIGWLDWLIDVLSIGVMLTSILLPLYLAKVHPHVKAIRQAAEKAAKDAAVTREQTENSHANAENPNLRDDLDAKFEGVNDTLGQLNTGLMHLATMLARVEEAQRRQDKELARIQEAQGDDREAVRRLDAKLDKHIDDKQTVEPRLATVERELKTHRRKTEPPSH